MFLLTVSEHPEVQEIRAPQPPDPEPGQITELVTESIPFPSFSISQEHPQAQYTTVNINELSASLGLPAAKADSTDDMSATASYKSQAPQAHPGALYGKLIGRALDEALTAKGLAEMLQNQDMNKSLEALAPAPTFPTASLPQQNSKLSVAQPSTRHIPRAELSNRHRVSIPVPTETASPSKALSAIQHQHRRSSASSASYRQHTRVSSNNRRRASRVKRIDQGPMPSAADIYPDDAHWTPAAPIYEACGYVSYHQEPIEQPRVTFGNLFNWPSPAEAYKPEPAPTAADIDAADIDVITLMSELPEAALNILPRLGNSQDSRISTAFYDDRPLTPAQEDGSRYGIRLYGLAYGDQWEPPKVGSFEKLEPFRVRPRDHGGWGGREWAMKRAWDA